MLCRTRCATTSNAASSLAASFRARTAALELADRNKLAAKAANSYLRRGRKK